MSAQFEHVIVFLVMTILVMLFAWIYLRDRQQRIGLWMLGWVAILVHFAAGLLAGFSFLSAPLADWLAVVTLEIAGICFLLSVSKACAPPRRRAAFMALIGAPSMVYATCLALRVGSVWLYRGIVVLSVLAAVALSVSYYRRQRARAWLACFVYAAPSLWVVQRIAASPEDGIVFFLCEYFAIAGYLYWQRYRRLTPGVLLTSLSFLAWGSVFPVAEILHAFNLGPPDESLFWDLPKYFVAFGMILTLFENQTELATRAAWQYQALFEGNLAAVWVSTFEGQLLNCNGAFLQMYGFGSKEEALAAPCVSFYADPAARAAFLEKLEQQGQVVNHECRQRRKDGLLFWMLERATIVTSPGGHKMIEGTGIDITERKLAEIALKQSEERFASIFRHSPVGCAILSLEGVFLNANETLLGLLGRPAGEVLGKGPVELGFWKSQQEWDSFYRTLRAQGTVRNLEMEFQDADGNRHTGLYFATLVRIGGEERILGMQLDCTEQRELEQKFRQAQKMEALGRLAGGVAHDFNNLLGVIGGYAELLESRLGREESYKRYCTKIIETTRRATGLTRQLLTFSRKEVVRPAPLRPDRAIGELAGILARLIGEDIELSVSLRSTGTIVMDQTHFEQIIFNIVINARDAMPGGGLLSIDTKDVTGDAAGDVLNPVPGPEAGAQGKRGVLIRIADNGAGMDEPTRLHAFDPFFTTKPVGRGTGLGLSTVYGIVRQCEGDIRIESRVGEGTQIIIVLPAVDAAVAERLPMAHDPVGGKGRILLVEDELELRNTNAEFLTAMGYSVTCAGSGPEALHTIREVGRIDLVISDVVMPKMNGREFTDRLLKLRPGVKVLFISGYADDVILQTGISTFGTPFLQKPFSLKELGCKVHELLSVAAH